MPKFPVDAPKSRVIKAFEKHRHQVNEIIERYITPKGIKTNEHRELLIVQKS